VRERSGAYRVSVGKLEGKRLLGKTRRRCENKIKMDLREVKWVAMNWIDLAQVRDCWRGLVNKVINLRVS